MQFKQLDFFRGQRDMFAGLDNVLNRSRIITEPRYDARNGAGKLSVMQADIAALEKALYGRPSPEETK